MIFGKDFGIRGAAESVNFRSSGLIGSITELAQTLVLATGSLCRIKFCAPILADAGPDCNTLLILIRIKDCESILRRRSKPDQVDFLIRLHASHARKGVSETFPFPFYVLHRISRWVAFFGPGVYLMLCLTSPRNLLRVPSSIGLFVGSLLFVMLAAEPVLAVVSPAPADDRFGWSRGDANSQYVGWTSFQDELGTGGAFDPINPVILDTTPDAAAAGSTGEFRETGSVGAFITGSAGIYSFTGATNFEIRFSGPGLNSGFTRVVAQVRTWGTEFDLNSVLLTSSSNVTGVSPAYVEETGRLDLGPAVQGSGPNDQVDLLLLWDLASSDLTYQIDLTALGPHQSFRTFQSDVFSQSIEFTTPGAAPEPSSLFVLSIASAGAVMVRRRRQIS